MRMQLKPRSTSSVMRSSKSSKKPWVPVSHSAQIQKEMARRSRSAASAAGAPAATTAVLKMVPSPICTASRRVKPMDRCCASFRSLLLGQGGWSTAGNGGRSGPGSAVDSVAAVIPRRRKSRPRSRWVGIPGPKRNGKRSRSARICPERSSCRTATNTARAPRPGSSVPRKARREVLSGFAFSMMQPFCGLAQQPSSRSTTFSVILVAQGPFHESAERKSLHGKESERLRFQTVPSETPGSSQRSAASSS